MAQTKEICSQTQIAETAALWDTKVVPKNEAFDFYREAICAAFMPLRPECSQRNRQGFHAKVRSYKLGQSVLNLVNANVHTVLRNSPEIAASHEDCYYLNMPLTGQSTIVQNGTSITLHTGDLGVFDSSVPFALNHGEAGRLGVASLMVPKRLLADMKISTPMVLSDHPTFGRTLAEAIYALAQSAEAAAHTDVPLLQRLILQLAPAACQEPQPLADALSRTTGQFLRIKRVLRQGCAHQDFDLSQCSKIVGLSSGYIQQICASHDARFGALLLEERLQLAQRQLRDGRLQHLPVSTIAYRSGFKDLSHFGRQFKKRFGISPGAWRAEPAGPTH